MVCISTVFLKEGAEAGGTEWNARMESNMVHLSEPMEGIGWASGPGSCALKHHRERHAWTIPESEQVHG
jgi:hypothetical protein